MAYLNVRERRIEAKIAYVGAPLSGKATNLERLGATRAGDGDLVSVDWGPASEQLASRFPDYELAVTLIASRGELAPDGLRDVLRDADGVVFVADATPSARARNEAALSMVRAALAADGRPDLPLVFQVNKTDADDALSADEVVQSLDVGAAPHVVASALRGEGVVETAERALGRILDELQRDAGALVSYEEPPHHNPLLTALKQVLRETVDEHVAAYEDKTGVLALQRDLRRELAGVRASLDGVGARLQELSRALESHTKAEREQATAAAAASRRSFDALSADLKATDPRPQLAELRSGLRLVSDETAELGEIVRPVTTAVRALAEGLHAIEAGVVREFRSANARAVAAMNERLDLLRVEASESHEKSEARAAQTADLLQGLIEELSKPKKTWFG